MRPICDNDFFGSGFLVVFSSEESFLSLLPRSNEAPGVFGVFPVPPKFANAPLPKPKLADPVPVGEATALVLMDPIELKGLFLPPWLLKLPKRLVDGASWLSLRSLLVERLSLLLLCRVQC